MSNVTYGPLVLFEMKMTSIQKGGTYVFCSVHIIYTGTWSHHHLLSSSLTFYLKFMRFSFRHFGWGLSWMIWIFWWLQACYLIKICQDWKFCLMRCPSKFFSLKESRWDYRAWYQVIHVPYVVSSIIDLINLHGISELTVSWMAKFMDKGHAIRFVACILLQQTFNLKFMDFLIKKSTIIIIQWILITSWPQFVFVIWPQWYFLDLKQSLLYIYTWLFL